MRKCTVCAHPEREAIDRALVAGAVIRETAAAFALSPQALQRHKQNHIPVDLAAAWRATAARSEGDRQARLAAQFDAQEAAAEGRAINLMAELEATMRRVKTLFEACDRWLVDPDDPSRYDLGPRAEEIVVTYTRRGPHGPVRSKATLSELLARAAGEDNGALQIGMVQLKQADPRDLLLKASQRLEAQLQLLARLMGQLAEPQPVVNVLVASPEWIATRTAILAALEPYPDARRAVAVALAPGTATEDGRHGT